MKPFLHAKSFFGFCILFFFLFLAWPCYAQQSSNYNLLWQITGNGLKKPSYIFGSMHTQDRRIFNFSDSVMKAMESCSAFVLETHPDSLMKSYDAETPRNNEQKDIKTVLTDEQITELLKRFEEKNGYLPDTSILNNPIIISALMKPDYSKDDDMQTFVDAYLYGIARTLKKKIFGLEKVETQLELMYGDDQLSALFEDNSQEQQQYFEELTNLYIKGNIEEIWKFISQDSTNHLNLIERNKVMATELIKLFASENVFATVGAAHLPGNTGIIAILKKAGYTLRPVVATFTGIAKNYTIDYSKMDWQNYNDPVNNYSISFPAMPVRIMRKKSIANLVYYSDISDGTIYNVTSYFTGPVIESQHVNYLDTILQNYTGKQQVEILSKKTIQKNGIEGLEAEFKLKGKYLRIVIYLQNNTFYALSAESKKNLLHEYAINRFFDSFQTIKPIAIAADHWIDYKNSAGAFSIKLPVKPEEIEKEVPNPTYPAHPYQIKLFMAADQANMKNYLFRYNDYPTGMYLANLKMALTTVNEQFIGKGKVVGEPRVIYKDGFEGRAIDLIIQDTYMEIRVYVRGNRSYLLLKQNLNSSEKAADDQFFESFKFEPYTDSKPIRFTIGNAKALLPVAPILMNGADEKEEDTSILKAIKSYYAVNANSGGVYGMQFATLSKYLRYQSIDTLYKRLIDEMMSKTDSLINFEDTMIGTIKGKFYSAKDTVGGTQKRMKMWVDHNRFYFQSAIIAQEESKSKTYQDFFNHLSYVPIQSSFNLQTSKAQLMMDDLRSADTTVFNSAFGALEYYVFEKDELPIIYQTLKLSFADDTSSYGVRYQLIETLKGLHDETTVPFLKTLFTAKNPDRVSAKILESVPAIDSTSYDWYLKNLIATPPLQLSSHWMIFNPLVDSLAYMANHFDQLLPLLDHKDYRYYILDLVNDMLDSKESDVYLPAIKSRQDQIMKKALGDIDAYVANQKMNPQNANAYLSILANLNMPELTDEFTKKVFKLDSVTFLHTTALATRIRVNLKLDPDILSAKLDSLDSRYQIMDAYRHAGRLNEVPLKYKKHDEFAKLLVYDYLVKEEDAYPLALNLLGKLATDSGSYYVFEILFNEEGEIKKYLGLSGAFDDKKPDLDFDQYFTHMEWEEVEKDWQAQGKAIIASYEEEEN